MAKMKVPKRVAGVKVPKKVRKQAKRALKLVDTPAARNLAIAGLTLAAENLVDRTQSRQTAREGSDEAAGRRRARAAVKKSLDDLNLGEVLRAAAAEGARRFLEGFEEGKAGAAKAKTKGNGKAPKASSPPRPGAE
jgi:hypothetical protein